ncbi:MAG: Uma2 family endonuclease [Saprospiraceae bacterium]|nr:Uma2 family endonuclease [Saprospiraceae bacterium]
MTAFAPQNTMTAEEYLRMQRSGAREMTLKYEFFNRKLRFMAGGSPNHNRISRNLTYLLERQIRENNTTQEVFAGDMRTISYLQEKNYLYPDVVLVDGTPYFDDENGDNLANPTLVIEVLSESTESFDRGDKFKSYRQTPSMREYILVNQKEKCIEQFFKNEKGRWQIGDIITEGSFKLETLPFELDVDDIYRNVTFDTTTSESTDY